MTRTTVRLPDALLTAAKQRAIDTGRTFTALLTDALLNELRAPHEAVRVCQPLPTFRGRGLRAGVALLDNSLLLDVMHDC